MSLALSSATPEVRTVPTCSDLSENTHALLALLTRTRGQNKGIPRVKGDLDVWRAALAPMDPDKVRLAWEDIQHLDMVRRDPNRPEGWHLWLQCKCPAGKKTDSSIPPRRRETEQSSRRGAPELATPVSSPAPCGRKRESDEEDETPGQSPQTCFPEMADEKDEDPRPRPKVDPDSPFGLALYFEERVILSAQKQRVRLMPGSISRKALLRQFRALLTEHSPAEVRGLIDHFAKGYRRYHKPGVDPGKVFLARRRGLYEEYRKAKTFMTERDPAKVKSRYTTLDDIRRKRTS